MTLEFLVPWLIAGALFYVLRRLERWLHQHIFKVGWLLTQNFQTTTILYYTFFLPGVLLHEIVYWLAAGVLNVRADRAIGFPEKQEVAELHLNFVKLSKKAGRVRLAIISTVPLATGIGVVLYIALNRVNISGFLAVLAQGELDALPVALSVLMSTQDFWLWVYFMFAISNTMMPNTKDLQGWWLIVGIIGVGLAVLLVLGAGTVVITNVLSGPVAEALNTLSWVFAVIIAVDSFMVLVLGTLESIIERITGHSATFKDGKLIAMTRAEMLAQREQQSKRERQLAAKKAPALASGPPSIYALQFPIPGAPGKEPVTQPPSAVIGVGASPTPTLKERSAPSVIASPQPTAPLPVSKPASMFTPPVPRLPAVSSGENQGDVPQEEAEEESSE